MSVNFSLLGGLALRLHLAFVDLYYMLLPVVFSLAVAVEWFKNPHGSPAFLGIVKRTIIATILVIGFQEISDTILALTNGVADRISDLTGLNAYIDMAAQKARSYPHSVLTPLLGFDDLTLAIITFASYFILYVARYLSVAVYHFMWILLSILAPLLLLFTIFEGTTSIVVNLFKSLFEVASYKIVWAVLSAMITSLSFGNAFYADGAYITLILMNFIIAVAMLATPLVVKAIVGGGLSGLSGTLSTGAALAIASVPTRAATAFNFGRELLGDTKSFLGGTGSKLWNHIRNNSHLVYAPLPPSHQLPPPQLKLPSPADFPPPPVIYAGPPPSSDR